MSAQKAPPEPAAPATDREFYRRIRTAHEHLRVLLNYTHKEAKLDRQITNNIANACIYVGGAGSILEPCYDPKIEFRLDSPFTLVASWRELYDRLNAVVAELALLDQYTKGRYIPNSQAIDELHCGHVTSKIALEYFKNHYDVEKA